MKEFEGTPGPWAVDVRGGCIAVYPDGQQDETAGCHRDDYRNIAYSNKGAEYDEVAGFWSMDRKTIHDYMLIAAAPELLEALLRVRAQFDQAGISPVKGSLNPVENNYAFINSVIAKALGGSQ